MGREHRYNFFQEKSGLTGLYGSNDGAELTIPNEGVTGFDELAAWFHANRAFGGGDHYCDTGGFAVTGTCNRQTQGSGHKVFEQS